MEEVIGGEKKSKTAFRLGVTIQYSWESLFSMMDSLVSKYQNYFSHHYLTQFHGFRSPLHANNLCPRLIYIHIHLPIKIFTWMSTQYLKQYIFKNKLRISNQPSAPSCKPPATSLFPLKSCPKQSPVHSLCPAHKGLLNVLRTNQRAPSPQGLCAHWCLYLGCPLPWNPHDSPALSVSAQMLLFLRWDFLKSLLTLLYFSLELLFHLTYIYFLSPRTRL